MKTKMIAVVLLSGVTFAHANPYAYESSIYKVEVPSPDLRTVNGGTGVLIAYDKILTNCHVVKNPGWPHVINRKTGRKYPVSKYTSHGTLDACILYGQFEGRPVPLANSYNIGDYVVQYGYPNNMAVVGQGNITGTVTTNTEGLVLQSSAFCNPGSSGGPLLNGQGQLVGLNFAVALNRRDSCLSIPVDRLRDFLH